MKKQFLSGAALVAFAAATPAIAAPPTPMQIVYNWTGFYVGGNAGYSWGHASSTAQSPTLGQFFGPAVYPSSQHLDGFIGGGQFGYNWQVNKSWVYGFETDFQGSAEKGTSFGCDTEGCQTHGSKIGWFGTTRVRLGFLITPTTLVYGTGGLAYGELKMSGFLDYNPFLGSTYSFSDTKIKMGTAIGAGIESAFAGTNWTWKVEYLHLDFGSLNGSTIETITGNPYTWNARFSDDIVRGGINYRIP